MVEVDGQSMITTPKKDWASRIRGLFGSEKPNNPAQANQAANLQGPAYTAQISPQAAAQRVPAAFLDRVSNEPLRDNEKVQIFVFAGSEPDSSGNPTCRGILVFAAISPNKQWRIIIPPGGSKEKPWIKVSTGPAIDEPIGIKDRSVHTKKGTYNVSERIDGYVTARWADALLPYDARFKLDRELSREQINQLQIVGLGAKNEFSPELLRSLKFQDTKGKWKSVYETYQSYFKSRPPKHGPEVSDSEAIKSASIKATTEVFKRFYLLSRKYDQNPFGNSAYILQGTPYRFHGLASGENPNDPSHGCVRVKDMENPAVVAIFDHAKVAHITDYGEINTSLMSQDDYLHALDLIQSNLRI